MAAPGEKKDFVEFRVFVAEADDAPSDLSLVTGSVLLSPKSGTPLQKDLQLMMPDPPLKTPATEPQVLKDGHRVRTSVAKHGRPFEAGRFQEGGRPAVYFKADLPADLARDAGAVILLKFPAGEQKLELRPSSD